MDAKVTLENNMLRLVVRDNGVGMSPQRISASRSLGLLGMQERAMMFGGNVEVQTAPGKGTCVTLTIPLEQAGEEPQ